MIMRSGFHFHHHETWFQKKPGLTLTNPLSGWMFSGRNKYDPSCCCYVAGVVCHLISSHNAPLFQNSDLWIAP